MFKNAVGGRAQYKQERVSSGSALASRGRGATLSDKDGEMHLKITLEFDVVDIHNSYSRRFYFRMSDKDARCG